MFNPMTPQVGARPDRERVDAGLRRAARRAARTAARPPDLRHTVRRRFQRRLRLA